MERGKGILHQNGQSRAEIPHCVRPSGGSWEPGAQGGEVYSQVALSYFKFWRHAGRGGARL